MGELTAREQTDRAFWLGEQWSPQQITEMRKLPVSLEPKAYCPKRDQLHEIAAIWAPQCAAATSDYEANLDHPSAGIRMGTQRFDYDHQRMEILLEEGWVPVVPDVTGEGMVVGIDPGGPDRSALIYDKAHRMILERRQVASQRVQTREAVLAQQLAEARNELALLKIANGGYAKAIERQAIALGNFGRIVAEREHEIGCLRKRLWLPVEPGEHDYIGPTKKNEETGKREAIPDPVHERFHGAVGDVLSGRVIPEARRQMQEALKNAPKEQAPLPVVGSKDDPRRMGWRVDGP